MVVPTLESHVVGTSSKLRFIMTIFDSSEANTLKTAVNPPPSKLSERILINFTTYTLDEISVKEIGKIDF